VIFEPTVFMEDSPSAASSARGKKSTARKSSPSDAGAKAQTKRRTRTNDSEENDVCVIDEDTSSAAIAPSLQIDSDMTSPAQEPQAMNQVHEESQWQQSQQDYRGSEGTYPQDGYVQEGDGYYEEDGYSGQEAGQYAQNQIVLTLSYSLMNQVRQTARMEGVLPEDILIELVAEGVARRVFEDAQRPAPSHLMTRTGYVAPDANGNVQQPQLSHHGMQGNNRGNHNGHNNRRFNQNNRGGNHFQGRNRQNNNFKNKQRNGK